MPAAGADEINLGFGNALNAATETINDFVGEFMGNQAGAIVGCTVLVLLAQDLRLGEVFQIIQPALHGETVSVYAQVAKGKHRGIDRCRTPGTEVDFGGLAGILQRIKTLGGDIEDASIVEVV